MIGKFLGPPTRGLSANPCAGTRSTCRSLYVNESCNRMIPPMAKTPKKVETTNRTKKPSHLYFSGMIVGKVGREKARVPRRRCGLKRCCCEVKNC